MKYRMLGKDLTVSAVGLVCMGMSHAYGAPSDKQEMTRLLAQAVELGCTFFDTAFEPGTDYRGAMPQFTPEAVEQNQALLELLRDTAREHNATPAQISLAWMLCKNPRLIPIPGTRKPDRLRENLGAAEVAPTSDEVSAIDRALDGMEMSQVFGGSQIVQK